MTPPEIQPRIKLTANPRRVRALYQNHVIADSEDVITLVESGLAPVQYFPRDDVAMEYAGKTARSTRCPYKGEASYYSIMMDGGLTEDALWSYEDPIAGMEALRGRIAFYPDKVEVYELVDEAMTSDKATD